jgi:hypothetical protein
VLDLVLVFVGFGLVPDLRAFHPFHPIANSTLFSAEGKSIENRKNKLCQFWILFRISSLTQL